MQIEYEVITVHCKVHVTRSFNFAIRKYCHYRTSNRAEKLGFRPEFEPRPARVLGPSGQQALFSSPAH